MLSIEFTYARGEITTWSWDPEFMQKLEDYLEANPEAGLVKDPNCLYRKLRNAQKDIINCVSEIVGGEADEPFTITIKVEGKPRKYGPGPVNY